MINRTSGIPVQTARVHKPEDKLMEYHQPLASVEEQTQNRKLVRLVFCTCFLCYLRILCCFYVQYIHICCVQELLEQDG